MWCEKLVPFSGGRDGGAHGESKTRKKSGVEPAPAGDAQLERTRTCHETTQRQTEN